MTILKNILSGLVFAAAETTGSTVPATETSVNAEIEAMALKDREIAFLRAEVEMAEAEKAAQEKDAEIEALKAQLAAITAPKAQPVKMPPAKPLNPFAAIAAGKTSVKTTQFPGFRSEGVIRRFTQEDIITGRVPVGSHLKLCRVEGCGGGLYSSSEIIGRNPHEGTCKGLAYPSAWAKEARDNLAAAGYFVKL